MDSFYEYGDETGIKVKSGICRTCYHNDVCRDACEGTCYCELYSKYKFRGIKKIWNWVKGGAK